jgi:hypothetical protein
VLEGDDLAALFSIFVRFEALYAEVDERRRRYGEDVAIEDAVPTPRIAGRRRAA